MVSFTRVAAIIVCTVVCFFGLLCLMFLGYITMLTLGFVTMSMTHFDHCDHAMGRNVCGLVIAPLIGVAVSLAMLCGFAFVFFVSACIAVNGQRCKLATVDCVKGMYVYLVVGSGYNI